MLRCPEHAQGHSTPSLNPEHLSTRHSSVGHSCTLGCAASLLEPLRARHATHTPFRAPYSANSCCQVWTDRACSSDVDLRKELNLTPGGGGSAHSMPLLEFKTPRPRQYIFRARNKLGTLNSKSSWFIFQRTPW